VGHDSAFLSIFHYLKKVCYSASEGMSVNKKGDILVLL
jgi:hypothetical protein